MKINELKKIIQTAIKEAKKKNDETKKEGGTIIIENAVFIFIDSADD